VINQDRSWIVRSPKYSDHDVLDWTLIKSMQESARGSAILITGATGSIGLEIAARTAAEGAVVGVHGSRPESVGGALEKLRRRVPAGQFVPLPADFRENGAIAALVEQFVADAGRLDGVVDCALGGPSGQVTGPFAATNPRHFLRLMPQRRSATCRPCVSRLCLIWQGRAVHSWPSPRTPVVSPRLAKQW